MTTIIPQSELVKRAAAWIAEHKAEGANRPGADLATLIDEAGARFNLGPLESEMLLDLFRTPQPDHQQE